MGPGSAARRCRVLRLGAQDPQLLSFLFFGLATLSFMSCSPDGGRTCPVARAGLTGAPVLRAPSEGAVEREGIEPQCPQAAGLQPAVATTPQFTFRC